MTSGDTFAELGPAPTPPPRQTSIGDLLRKLVDDIINLVRSELKLARAEVSENLRQSAVGLIAVGIGAMLAMVATTCLLVATIAWLATQVGLVAATLIVAGASGVAAAVLIMVGVSKLQRLDLAPRRATANLQRSVEMLKGD